MSSQPKQEKFRDCWDGKYKATVWRFSPAIEIIVSLMLEEQGVKRAPEEVMGLEA